MNAQNIAKKTEKGTNVKLPSSNFIGGTLMPTTKFDSQLTSTAMDMAAGLGPVEKSSAVIIHGMEPGPTAKKSTKPRVDTTDT